MLRNSAIAVMAAAVALSGGAVADTYVRTSEHTDGFYAGGTTTPPEDSIREMWIGEDRMAFFTEAIKVIVDRERKSVVFVNRRDNTYVETDLPVTLEVLFSEEDLGNLMAFRRTGTVEKTAESKKVGKWECTRYHLTDWIPFEDGRVSEREVDAWVAPDVPFDVDRFRDLFAILAKLSNLHDEYVSQIQAIDGFQIVTKETRYQEGQAITTSTEVQEMKEAEPPADVFAVPEGCTKKDKLTLADLRG